jgi:hypothetical protein
MDTLLNLFYSSDSVSLHDDPMEQSLLHNEVFFV